MKQFLLILLLIASCALLASPARAEKFGFCEDSVKTGTDCFLQMTEETYRKCRLVQSMMIIEYGFFESYLPDNNGEKLNFCIEKHRNGIKTSYQAALKELAKRSNARQAITQLYQAWLGDLEALIPAIVETKEAYDERVAAATSELADKMNFVRAALTTATVTAAAPAKSTTARKGKRH